VRAAAADAQNPDGRRDFVARDITELHDDNDLCPDVRRPATAATGTAGLSKDVNP
jgi:hypothetical protein